MVLQNSLNICRAGVDNNVCSKSAKVAYEGGVFCSDVPDIRITCASLIDLLSFLIVLSTPTELDRLGGVPKGISK